MKTFHFIPKRNSLYFKNLRFASELETLQAIQQHGDLNPIQRTRLAELQATGATGNPAGIESPTGSYLNPSPTTSTGMGVGDIGAFNQPTIDLPKIYEGLYANSGIKNTELALSQKTNDYNTAVAKIKDNPYLSEATLTGRLSKLADKYNADITGLKSDVATRKADIETKLNLQTKQFDINSQQARAAFDQFQSLLSNGALDNASGEDIANLTRATGLSSSMIRSAIGVSQKKNAPKVNTQVIQTDDGTNVYAVVINQDTGQVINKQLLGASTPTAAEVKAGLDGKGTSDAAQIKADKAAAPSAAAKDAANKMTLGTLMKLYSQYGLSNQQIYDIYLANTSYKQNEGTIANDTAKYNVKHN